MQGFNIPKEITTGMFSDITIPSFATDGYATIWNDSLHKINWVSLGTAAYLNVGVNANNILQLNAAGDAVTEEV